MRYTVEIRGETPLLQNRFHKAKSSSPEEEARAAAYRGPGGRICHPASSIPKLIAAAGPPAGRSVGRRRIQSSVRVIGDDIPILSKGREEYEPEVDSRPVSENGSRSIRNRAKIEEWSSRFVLEFDDGVVTPDEVHELLSRGGRSLGIGDYRPERGGTFGRFYIQSWCREL